MKSVRVFLARCLGLFRGPAAEDDMNEELKFHIETETLFQLNRGLSRDDARSLARKKFGGLEQTKELIRETKGLPFIESLVRDIRYGFRVLKKSPGFSMAAIITIALGISVNTAVFTLVNTAYWSELPFENPDEVAYVRMPRISYPDFEEIRDQSRTMTMGAFSGFRADLSDSVAAPERVRAYSVSANSFSLLGQNVLVGRDFTPEDEAAGAEPVALIGYRLWQTRYEGNPNVAGQPVRINLRDYTIVGVLPDPEGFPKDAELWVPLVPDDPTDRSIRNVEMFGRVGHGANFDQAQAEFDTVVARMIQEHPETNPNTRASVVGFRNRDIGGQEDDVLFGAMLGAVAFVLLIACANVANLLLSRMVQRTRESSIRVAVGATRWLVARQLLIESIMLSLAGSVVGLGLAYLGVGWFARQIDTFPDSYLYWATLEMDYRVFVHLLGICLAAGVLFGLAPALQISKTNVAESLKDGGRAASGGIRPRRLTSALVISELALTIVLLVGAGLFVRSFLNFQNFDFGIDREGILGATVELSPARYEDDADVLAFADRMNERIPALPGVDGFAMASHRPGEGAIGRRVRLGDRDIRDSAGEFPIADRVAVNPGYFEALRLSPITGRTFTSADGRAGTHVAIVDEVFADRFWPGQNPIGRRIQEVSDDEDESWLTIVGVSPRVYQRGPIGENDPRARSNFYVPFAQEPVRRFSILTRSANTEVLSRGLRNEIQQLDADLPLFDIWTLEGGPNFRSWNTRLLGTLFGAFAVIALVMSSVGIFGVTAYGVNQRKQEIGLRIALGASQSSIMWMVFKQGLWRVLAGLSIGLFATWGLGRVLERFLYEVRASDPLTFIAISLLLGIVTLAACLIPARRAVRLEPADALRLE